MQSVAIAPARSMSVKVALASLIGTSIEWYDFYIYGLSAALVFPALFFPKYSAFAGLLASYAIFWVGFLGRPLGGVIFGHFGDRVGRKAMLVTTLTIMGLATFAIGVIPAYQQIGVWAPLLLVVLRFAQGVAVGGEWGGAVLMAGEHAPRNLKGYFASWPQIGVPVGLILSNLVFRNFVAHASIDSGAWRIPFLSSIVLVMIGLAIRLSITETPTFQSMKSAGAIVRSPVLSVLASDWKTVLLAAGMFFVTNGGFYLRVTQLVSYGSGPHSVLKLDPGIVLNALIAGACVSLLVLPLAGGLSDRIGRRPVFLAGALLLLIASFPIYWMIDTKSAVLITLAVCVWELGSSLMYGPLAAQFCEMFRGSVRYSGASVGYQFVTIFAGGLAPFIATYLLQLSSGASWVLSLYLMAMATVSFVSGLLVHETKDVELKAA